MEFVQRDVACCGREKNGNAQQTCLFVIKPEPPCDAVTNGPHADENSVLHHHKNHGMTENGEERGKEKNDRLDVVAEQGNGFNRDIEASVNQLPDRLNIIGEVEAPILEIRPARVGSPGPDKEGNDGDGRDNNVARCSLVTFDHSWLGSLQLTRIFTAPVNWCQAQLFPQAINEIGGRGGIRTHGGLPHARFRVECLKPDSATLPQASGTSNIQSSNAKFICPFSLAICPGY